MDLKYIVCLFLLNILTNAAARKLNLWLHRRQNIDDELAKEDDNVSDNVQLYNINKENLKMDPSAGILGMGGSNEQKSEELKPGHTLIRPNNDMLQSSATYPQKHVSNTMIYGGPASINRRPTDLLNTGFRKNNQGVDDALRAILQAVQDIDHNERGHRNSDFLVYLERKHPSNRQQFRNLARNALPYDLDTRRKKKSKSEESETESSDSTEQEENPGNPYTIYKDKYKQNWPWNFEMDGDHMNLNPNGPEFSQSWGPSGSDLFFSRKWWYFNQDDYLPFR